MQATLTDPSGGQAAVDLLGMARDVELTVDGLDLAAETEADGSGSALRLPATSTGQVTFSWDGTDGGAPLAAGTYVLEVSFTRDGTDIFAHRRRIDIYP